MIFHSEFKFLIHNIVMLNSFQHLMKINRLKIPKQVRDDKKSFFSNLSECMSDAEMQLSPAFILLPLQFKPVINP
jgi:hypothetical protein